MKTLATRRTPKRNISTITQTNDNNDDKPVSSKKSKLEQLEKDFWWQKFLVLFESDYCSNEMKELLKSFDGELLLSLHVLSDKFEMAQLVEYFRFICLKAMEKDVDSPMKLSPSPLIDEIWHYHLLHPTNYIFVCEKLLEKGKVFFHSPKKVPGQAERFELTKTCYKKHFGEDFNSAIWFNSIHDDNAPFVVVARTLTGRSDSLKAYPNETIWQLKMRYQSITGIPPDQVRMMFEGRIWEDMHLTKHCQLKDGSTIDIILRLRTACGGRKGERVCEHQN